MDLTTPQPLEPAWLAAIDEAARAVLGPLDRRGDALASEVARLSELYTRGRGALREQSAVLAARLRFFLPRDLPKLDGPLTELAFAGALPAARAWRVLDLGSGLGTTTLGLSRYARRAGIESLDVLAVERDLRASDVMRFLANRCGKGGLTDSSVETALETRDLDLSQLDPRGFGGPFDFILLGLSLNELWIEHPDPIERRTTLLMRALDLLSEDGALIVIEPALRESSRELQRVRDQLVFRTGRRVFAPCTRTGPCPMLETERDWCHEDLPLALPDPLRELARAAGLRWEGLSYSYLTMRRGGTLADFHRVVGGPVTSKGRTEWHLCHESGISRLARLDRFRDPRLEGARRGSLLRVEAAPAPQHRADRIEIERIR